MIYIENFYQIDFYIIYYCSLFASRTYLNNAHVRPENNIQQLGIDYYFPVMVSETTVCYLSVNSFSYNL